ncbi:MAG: hypothetical protein Q7T80_07920 [Methanoregula sp.]|nr:hypothetical protein [Methanoregula sp.]
MHAEQECVKNSVVPDRMLLFLWVLVVLTALFCLLIFFIPLDSMDTYHLISNACEGAIALICMISCLYAYRTWSEQIIVILAAFAYGGYALSNTFWYLYSEAFNLSDEFISISELGFLGFMLFFIVAFRIEFQKKPCPVSTRIFSGGLFLIIALIMFRIAGINPTTVMSAFWFLIIALLIDAALDHGVYRNALLWQGICLWSFTSILYGFWYDAIITFINEESIRIPFAPNLLTLQDFFDNIIGPLFFLSFLLIQLGIFKYLNSPEW